MNKIASPGSDSRVGRKGRSTATGDWARPPDDRRRRSSERQKTILLLRPRIPWRPDRPAAGRRSAAACGTRTDWPAPAAQASEDC